MGGELDVAVTTEALLPISQETQRYVGGGIGYVVEPGRYKPQDRVVHTFVHLVFPQPPFADTAEKVGGGTVGDWPTYPEDLWSGGNLAHELGGLPYGPGGGAWDR